MIKKQPMFATPETIKDLENYIESMNGSERAVGYIVMGMTWNLCAELVNKQLKKEEKENE